MNRIIDFYYILFSTYGRQGWWPVTSEGETNPQYHCKNHLSNKQKLEIACGAILTQNTSWKNAEKAIIELNKNRLIDIKNIMEVPHHKLAMIIRSSGYHNQKAERLKIFCSYLEKSHQGNISHLFRKPLPQLRSELLSIKGIGPETADSIILYSAQKAVFVIDEYTKRIFVRLGFDGQDVRDYEDFQRIFHAALPHDVEMFKEYHALIVEHGKQRCTTKPHCKLCVLHTRCRFYRINNANSKIIKG